MKSSSLESRRAVEALRSGVPNAAAVQVLGCGQPHVERRFRSALESVSTAEVLGRALSGILVEGGFGSGKSHLLESLRETALGANFVCSRIVISKETPLCDPNKVFLAAVHSATVPGLAGSAIHEVAARLDTKSDTHGEFYRYLASSAAGMSQIFAATLLLHERLKNDIELVEEIVNFWAGEKLSIQRIKAGLKQIGASDTYRIKAIPAKELGIQRFRFAAQLIRAAGFQGWVLLFDEVELIGRYSALQRGKSYAELARWLVKGGDSGCPGTLAVAGITDDFMSAVLDGKGDGTNLAAKLREKGTEEYDRMARLATAGMQTIQRDAVRLEGLDSSSLADLHERVRRIHSEAFDWQAPAIDAGIGGPPKPIRAHIRRWIHEWDLRRLNPGVQPEIEDQELQVSYVEESELEESQADGIDVG